MMHEGAQTMMSTANSAELYRNGDADQDSGGAFAGGALAGYASEDTFSVIDRHSNFDGTFHSDRDLRIEGEVKGTIECQGTLFVAQGANVTAKVEAENITVAGDLNGDIRCRGRLQLMPSGRVRGKVATDTLVINEGAYYEGQLEMAAPETRTGVGAGSAPRPLPAVTASPTPVASSRVAPPEPRVQAAPANGGNSSTTFIRRLGGAEMPWDARRQEEEQAATPPEEPRRED
jgi:cytoskeletal protein CcmA (bactofilin family)